MEAMRLAWDFFQNQILGMKWLSALIGRLLCALGVDITGRWGGALQFFIYDTIKIFVLLSVLIFGISYIQSFFPPERTKKILGRFHGLGANTLAALLGTVLLLLVHPVVYGVHQRGHPAGGELFVSHLLAAGRSGVAGAADQRLWRRHRGGLCGGGAGAGGHRRQHH